MSFDGGIPIAPVIHFVAQPSDAMESMKFWTAQAVLVVLLAIAVRLGSCFLRLWLRQRLASPEPCSATARVRDGRADFRLFQLPP